MKRAHDIIALPVIDLETGRELGDIKDLVFSSSFHIRGVQIEPRRWFSAPRWIHWEGLAAIGEDAVTIPHVEVIDRYDSNPEDFVFHCGSKAIRGKAMYTVGGQRLGRVEDVYFGLQWGKQIIGFEISDGLIADLRDGRLRIAYDERMMLGEHALIVPDQCNHEMNEPLHQ